jgi:hypothetical protein
MKTTLNLNDELVLRAKALAARQKTSLTSLIEEGLQLRLSAQRVRVPQTRLPVYRGKGGLAAGVDGTSNRKLLEAAEEEDDA